MFKIIFIIAISFFAVVGVIECIACALESVSTSKYSHNIDNITLRFDLYGKIEDVSFLLNTFLLQAERISYNDNIVKVVVNDSGLEQNTYKQVSEFCSINNNISIEN